MGATMIAKMTKSLALCLSTVLLIGSLPAAMAQDAGSVVFVKGDVSAERQPPEALVKGDAIRTNDTVVTGDASRAQLLMLDGAKIAIRPNSRLRIEEFSFTPPATSGATITSSNDKSVMSLVKGGFRTITGAIGKQNAADYEVRTAVGVLGIRGTDYTAVFCSGDCDWVPGVAAGAAIPDGLYLGVTAGVIVFRTSTTTIELKAGEYAFIPLDEPEPQRLDSPPAVLLDDNDLRFDPGSDSSGAMRPDGDRGMTGFNATLGTRRAPQSSSVQAGSSDSEQDPKDDGSSSDAPEQPIIATDPDGSPVDITPGTQPPPTDPRTIAFSGGPFGVLDTTFTATDDNAPGQYRLDINNNLLGFDTTVIDATGASDQATFDIGSASNVETGFDSMTVMRWGRWSGGTMTTTLASDGSTDSISLANRSLHWISGPEGVPPSMPITGVANYTLIGNTSPTDDQGNVGTLGSASFRADFVTMLVDSTLDLIINGSNWVASGNGMIGAQAGLAAHLFQGNYSSLIIDGITGGGGSFSGFFSGPGPTSDPGFPGAAGLTYSVQDPQTGVIVSGAAVFGNP